MKVNTYSAWLQETLSRKVPNPAEDQEMIDIVKRHLDGEDEVRFDCLDVDDAELLQKGLQRARRIGQVDCGGELVFEYRLQSHCFSITVTTSFHILAWMHVIR